MTRLPLVVAPMAGGPSTPALVVATAVAGATGMLAGGYTTQEQLHAHIRTVQSQCQHFGVNLFAPQRLDIDVEAYAEYARVLQPLGSRYGVATTDIPACESDDNFAEKVAVLIEARVPIATFTFGTPETTVVAALQRVGTRVGQTVTSAAEAEFAASRGIDFVVAQSFRAGGHSGVMDPTAPLPSLELPELVREVREATNLPVWAAGGIAHPRTVVTVLEAGAEAAVIGTAALLAHEAGTHATHRAALQNAAQSDTASTVMTHAFSGRPARSLRNEFTDTFTNAPLGYPAVHYLAAPIRRAAAAAGDAEWTNLWAGTEFASAQQAPIAAILASLSPIPGPDAS